MSVINSALCVVFDAKWVNLHNGESSGRAAVVSDKLKARFETKIATLKIDD